MVQKDGSEGWFIQLGLGKVPKPHTLGTDLPLEVAIEVTQANLKEEKKTNQYTSDKAKKVPLPYPFIYLDSLPSSSLGVCLYNISSIKKKIAIHAIMQLLFFTRQLCMLIF